MYVNVSYVRYTYNSGTSDRNRRTNKQYSFDGKVTIWSDMTMPIKNSCCPTLLLSIRWLSLNLLQSVKCWRSHWIRVCCEKRENAAVAWVSCVHWSKCEAPHWFGTQRAGGNVQTSAMSPYHYQRSESSERYNTAECCTAATPSFENSSSTKSKWQKRHSSSPLPGAGPKRKCGRCATVFLNQFVFNILVPVMAQMGSTIPIRLWPCFTPKSIIFGYTANKINFGISLSLRNIQDTAEKFLSVSGSKMDCGAKFCT